MKLTKIFLILLTIFTSFQICFSQEEQKAVLFGKFGKVVQEEFASNFEGFYKEVVVKPTSQGYIVIHPKKNSTNQNFRRERGYRKICKGFNLYL